AMQLLPSRYFPRDSDGRPWHPALDQFPHEALYRDPVSPPGVIPDYLNLTTEIAEDLRERVADVASFHQLLGDPTHALHPESWLIYGTGRTTETHINFVSGEPAPGTELLGDETVPAVSATILRLPEARMIRAPGVEHSKACLDSFVQQQVENILVGYA
ncbi:MAG: hypothetical protein ACM35G_14830, partial [Planctomycetaceae bacterium]